MTTSLSSRPVSRALLVLVSVLSIATITFDSSPAYARKGIAIINTGDQLFEVGPFPEELEVTEPGAQVGALCNQFGLFWAGIWTSDCKLVAYFPADDSYADLPPELLQEVEKTYSTDDAKRGLWNRFGVLALLLLIVAYGAFSVLRGGDDDEES